MFVSHEQDSANAHNDQEKIDIVRLLDMLPHRYPFLLVDKIIQYEPGDYAIGLKRLSYNEPYFVGAFPATPIMPGAMIIETMAQTAAALVMKTLGDYAEGNLTYFTSIEKTRFLKPIVPGDTIHTYAKLVRSKRMIWKLKAHVKVGDEIHAYSSFTAKVLA